VHLVLAKAGVAVPMSDLFGLAGQHLLDTVPLGRSYAIRTESLRDLITADNTEIEMLDPEIGHWTAGAVGFHAVRAILGVGPCSAPCFSPRSATP